MGENLLDSWGPIREFRQVGWVKVVDMKNIVICMKMGSL